jgi:hypothetical protein
VAEDVTTSTEAVPVTPRPVAPHRLRFSLIYGGLGAVLVGAIVVLVLYAGRSISPGPTWSSWKPSGGGEGAAKQIADHVAQAYRLSSGDQLVDVIAKAPAVSPASTVSIPIHYVAIRGTKGRGDRVVQVSSSNSIMYSLCGLGTSCAITSGKPTVARGTLVRREILELALYTFKYVGGIKSVIAFMPPALGTQPKYVVYLQKEDVKSQLKAPLGETLGKKVPLPSTISAREVQTVDSVTESRVYSFSLSQAQQGDAILVLAPLAA